MEGTRRGTANIGMGGMRGMRSMGGMGEMRVMGEIRHGGMMKGRRCGLDEREEAWEG